METEAEALVGDEHDLIGPGGQAHADEFIVVFQVDGDDAVLAVVAEVVERGLLDLAGAGGEEDVAGVLAEGDVVAVVVGGAFEAQQRGDFFLGFQVEHVADAAAHRGARAFREFINPLDIDAAGVGEEHQIVVRLDGEQVLDEIIRFALAGGAGFHALETLAAAALQAVFGGGRAFHITAVGKRDDHRVVGDEVLHGDFAGLGEDRALARRGVFVADGAEFVLDDGEHADFAGEDVHQVLDVDEDAVVFALHLVAFHAGKLIEAEFEDGVDLALGENVTVALHGGLSADEDAELLRGGGGELIGGEAFAGFVAVFRIADDLDEVIEVAEREQEGFQQFGAFLGFA